MKINLYAPVNGELNKIEDLNDGVFSEKMLGDGFYIKPSEKDIHSAIENAKVVQIFETKHALILNYESINILIHIGIETVNLKGKPFEVKVKEKDQVDLQKTLVDVDFDSFKDKYRNEVCITFVNASDFKKYDFKITKYGNVKQGELIGYLEILEEVKIVEKQNVFYNRYEKLAEEIYLAVGKEANYNKFWNCITRLRFSIKDKNLVEEDKLKNLKNTQGFVWSGSELQIVIGADVIKARDAFEKYINNLNKTEIKIIKEPTFNIIKKSISGIMTMLIPYLIASGMLYAIFSLLQNIGAVESVWIDYTDLENIKFINEYDMWTGIFYIICTSGLAFMGFAFGYCTIKFLGGNTVIGGLICLVLLGIPLYGGLSWELFKVGEVTFSIQGYTNLVIPQVTAAIFYVKFDKWIKTWIPSVVDLILRHVLTVFVTLTLTFLLIGPIMGLIELVFYYILQIIDAIPFGISVGLWSMLAPCLTVLGIAWAVSAPFTASVASGTPNAMTCAWYLGEFSMAAASFAVAAKTKNYNTRRLALNTGVTGIFGISEPALYTILLPRIKTFWISIVSAGFAGLVVGAMGLKVYQNGGGGIFFFTQFLQGGSSAILLASLGMLISFSTSFCLTLFFWKEQLDHSKEIKHINKKVLNSVRKINLAKNLKINLEEYKENLDSIKKYFNTEYNDEQKTIEKLLNKRLQLEVKLISIRDKIEKINYRLAFKNMKEVKKQSIQNKLQSILNFENEIESKFLIINQESKISAQNNEKLQNEILNYIRKLLIEMSNELDEKWIEDYINEYINAIYNIEIFYNYRDEEPIIVNRITVKEVLKGELKNGTVS